MFFRVPKDSTPMDGEVRLSDGYASGILFGFLVFDFDALRDGLEDVAAGPAALDGRGVGGEDPVGRKIIIVIEDYVKSVNSYSFTFCPVRLC